MDKVEAFNLPASQLPNYELEDYSTWLDRVLPAFENKFGDQAFSFAEWYYVKKFEQSLSAIQPQGLAGELAPPNKALQNTNQVYFVPKDHGGKGKEDQQPRGSVGAQKKAPPVATSSSSVKPPAEIGSGKKAQEPNWKAVAPKPKSLPKGGKHNDAEPEEPSPKKVKLTPKEPDVPPPSSSWKQAEWTSDGWKDDAEDKGWQDDDDSWGQWHSSSSKSSGWKSGWLDKVPSNSQWLVHKANDWVNTDEKNRTGWMNKSVPLTHHLINGKHDVAACIAEQYSHLHSIAPLLSNYKKFLKN
jgi:hypothetical protein